MPVLLGSTANEGHLLFPVNEQLSRADKRLRQQYLWRTGQPSAAYAVGYFPRISSTRDRYRPFYGYSMRDWAGYIRRQNVSTYLYMMEHVRSVQIYLADEPALDLPDGPAALALITQGT